jgi:hypothetical protein
MRWWELVLGGDEPPPENPCVAADRGIDGGVDPERGEAVEGKGRLEPVGADVWGVPAPADVIHQDIDPGTILECLVGPPPHLRLRRPVRGEHIHVSAGGSTNRAGRIFDALGVGQ